MLDTLTAIKSNYSRGESTSDGIGLNDMGKLGIGLGDGKLRGHGVIAQMT